jgi:hypothetical protein
MPGTSAAKAERHQKIPKPYGGRVSFHLIAVCGSTVPLFVSGNFIGSRNGGGPCRKTGEAARNKSCSQSWIIDRDGRTLCANFTSLSGEHRRHNRSS